MPVVGQYSRDRLVDIHTRVFLDRDAEGRSEERRHHHHGFFDASVDTYLAVLEEGNPKSEARETTHSAAFSMPSTSLDNVSKCYTDRVRNTGTGVGLHRMKRTYKTSNQRSFDSDAGRRSARVDEELNSTRRAGRLPLKASTDRSAIRR